MESGKIVRSISGHDKNRFYMIVEAKDGFVWIADGKRRKLLKPKRKNARHVAPTSTILCIDEVTSDKRLRYLLRPFNGPAGDTEREGV